jgi:hypothetical protein
MQLCMAGSIFPNQTTKSELSIGENAGLFPEIANKTIVSGIAHSVESHP